MPLGETVLNYSWDQYGDHVFQNVGIWQFANKSSQLDTNGYWIV